MKRYLGVDLGSKTIGLAISESGIIAQALTTLRFTEDQYDEAVAMIVKHSKAQHIDVIVLGYPKHMNNDIGKRGLISEAVKEKIEAQLDAKVVLQDERLSTKSALDAMIAGGAKRHIQKQKKDELAAVVILQNYLDRKGDPLT